MKVFTCVLLSCALIGVYSYSSETVTCLNSIGVPCSYSSCETAATEAQTCYSSKCTKDEDDLEAVVACYKTICVSANSVVKQYQNLYAQCVQTEIDAKLKTTTTTTNPTTFTDTSVKTNGAFLNFSLSLIITMISSIIF